jgi:hypothetical protein
MSDIPFSSFANGNDRVGDLIAHIDVGATFPRGGSEYLRTGVVVPSTGYDGAAAIDFLRATGAAATQATSLSGYTDIATDGGNNWVIAYGSTSNVLVSTDNRATWATVAHNAGGGVAINSVCYSAALGLFICAGNTSTQFFIATQTAASVASGWTVRTGSNISAGSSDATTLIRASANEVIAVCGNAGANGCVSRSTNGTSWTAKNLALAIGNNSLPVQQLTHLGSSIWIAQGSSSMQRTTDGGDTWATVTTGSTTSILGSAFGAGLLIQFDTSGALYTSTNGASGSFTNRGNPFGLFTVRQLMFDGTRFIASLLGRNITGTGIPAYGYSTDGLVWKVRGFANKSWPDSSPTRIYSNGNDMLFIPYLGNSTGAVYGSFSDTSQIGIPYQIVSSSNSNMFLPTIYYVRVK